MKQNINQPQVVQQWSVCLSCSKYCLSDHDINTRCLCGWNHYTPPTKRGLAYDIRKTRNHIELMATPAEIRNKITALRAHHQRERAFTATEIETEIEAERAAENMETEAETTASAECKAKMSVPNIEAPQQTPADEDETKTRRILQSAGFPGVIEIAWTACWGCNRFGKADEGAAFCICHPILEGEAISSRLDKIDLRKQRHFAFRATPNEARTIATAMIKECRRRAHPTQPNPLNEARARIHSLLNDILVCENAREDLSNVYQRECNSCHAQHHQPAVLEFLQCLWSGAVDDNQRAALHKQLDDALQHPEIIAEWLADEQILNEFVPKQRWPFIEILGLLTSWVKLNGTRI